MSSRWKRFRDAYTRFAEGKGFALLVTLCVAVITGTAIWTGSSEEPYIAPTPPVSDEQHASVLMQQSLRSAATPTPLPASRQLLWQPPLPEVHVVRGYSASTMVCSGVTGVWALHEAVDLRAGLGDPVCAMADGIVSACGSDKLLGSWIEIRHEGGYVSRYAGLEMLGALQNGDQVRAGQTVGFAGNGMLEETDLGPHLHLQLLLNGKAVDPLSILD